MVADSYNPFYVLKQKDNGKEKIYRIDLAAPKWQPRLNKSGRRKYQLKEATYVNGVPFFEGWYLIPFWAMQIVDKKGNKIAPTEPHAVTEKAYDEFVGNDDFGFNTFGDGITAASMDAEDELPPLDLGEYNGDGSMTVDYPIPGMAATASGGGSSAD